MISTLLIVAAATLARWLVSALNLKRRSPAALLASGLLGALAGLCLTWGFVVLPFGFQLYAIPSQSMSPTLKSGDYVFVNKLVYKMSKPSRYDIVVFMPPAGVQANREDAEFLVKRIVATAGEFIEVREGTVFVNGDAYEEAFVPDKSNLSFKLVEHRGNPWPVLQRGLETNSERLVAPRYVVTDPVEAEELRTAPPIRVPPDHVVVLGDNRVASADSRSWGVLPVENVVGRFEAVILPLSRIGRHQMTRAWSN